MHHRYFFLTLMPMLALMCISTSATAQPMIGFSSEDDLYCESGRDLTQEIAAPNTQVEGSFFVTSPDEYFSIACTFCVSDKNAVDIGSMNITSQVDPVWVVNLQDSESNPGTGVSQSIKDQYPNYICWAYQVTDFSFSVPFVPTANAFSISLDASSDFEFIIDPGNSAWFNTAFDTGFFEVCDTLQTVGEPPVTATEETSWGGVKTLFR